VFTHDNAQLLGGREDVVTTPQFDRSHRQPVHDCLSPPSVTDRFDISMAIPVVATSLKVVSNATIQRLGTTNPLTHFLSTVERHRRQPPAVHRVGHASGVGDLTIRLKGRVKERNSTGVSLGFYVRLPTGDEMNLLGTGAAGLRCRS